MSGHNVFDTMSGHNGAMWQCGNAQPSPTFLILAWDLKIQGSNLPVDFVCLKMAKITPFILVTGVTFLQNGEKML